MVAEVVIEFQPIQHAIQDWDSNLRVVRDDGADRFSLPRHTDPLGLQWDRKLFRLHQHQCANVLRRPPIHGGFSKHALGVFGELPVRRGVDDPLFGQRKEHRGYQDPESQGNVTFRRSRMYRVFHIAETELARLLPFLGEYLSQVSMPNLQALLSFERTSTSFSRVVASRFVTELTNLVND